MPRLTPQTAEKRRHAILEAALRVTLERGLSQCTMENIAKEAGVAVGSLYTHFSGREEIGRAIATEILGAMTRQLNAQHGDLHSIPSPMSFIRVVDALLKTNGVPPGLMLEVYALASRDLHIRDLALDSLQQITDAYSAAVRAARVNANLPVDDDAIAHFARGTQALMQAWVLRSAIGASTSLDEFEDDISAATALWSSAQVA